MSNRAVTWLRATIVVLYALVAATTWPAGVTTAELVLLAVLGVAAFVAVVLADWVNHGIRRDGEEAQGD